MDKVIFPSFLWRSIGEIISNDYLERAFFLIGLYWRDKIIIYDLVEFKYVDRSPVSVIGDPHQKILLMRSLIPGTRILGIMHSHPFTEGKPVFSSIDMSDFRDFGDGLFIVTSRDMEYDILLRSLGEERRCDLIIRELTSDERPESILVDNKWRIVFPSGASKWEIETYAPMYLSELVSQESSFWRVVLNGKKALINRPRYYDVFKAWNPLRIPYRAYLSRENKDNLNELKTIIGNMFNYDDYELKIIEDEREIIILRCKGRCV